MSTSMYNPDLYRAEASYRREQISRMWQPIRERRRARRERDP
jgi:hypothetical protein